MVRAPKQFIHKTLIEEEAQLNGVLSFNDTVTIKGRFDGEITAKGTLVIQEGAKVNANVTAKHLIIAGEITGNCVAQDLLELTSTSKLKGNIKTRKLKIADGVKFEGNCEMIK